MEQVPTIDVKRRRPAELAAVDVACRDHGFFLLSGHGLDDLIERTWDETRRLFAAPSATKEALRRSEEQPLGYYDRELTKRQRDCKEVFDYMQPDGPIGNARNRWPEDLPGFREAQTAFFDAMGELAVETLALVYEALGAPRALAGEHGVAVMTSTVRLNHYPTVDPVPAQERAGLAGLADVALGHHTDPGVLTLLLQDDTGGLQAHSRDEGWIDVPPQPGTIVVNLADSLQVWTNDRYRAAVHRVKPMSERARYSIPYFANPALQAVIQPLPALCDGPPRYRPFTWREFISARVDDNYHDLGEEDTQASHFRIADQA